MRFMKVPARLDGYLHTKWVRHFWAARWGEDTVRITRPKTRPPATVVPPVDLD